MKNDSKQFDPSHYKADDNAKEQVIGWMGGFGWNAYVNPDQYGIDVLAERGERQLAVEVEVKHNWSGQRFPFSTVHFSARKIKFAQVLEREVWFSMLNDERDRILLVGGEIVAQADIVEKATIYTNNERFIQVPVSMCRILPIG